MSESIDKLSHEKIREEMEKYIVQMKATEFIKDDYLSKTMYVELLKAVIQIEHINLDYGVKQKKLGVKNE